MNNVYVANISNVFMLKRIPESCTWGSDFFSGGSGYSFLDLRVKHLLVSYDLMWEKNSKNGS